VTILQQIAAESPAEQTIRASGAEIAGQRAAKIKRYVRCSSASRQSLHVGGSVIRHTMVERLIPA
jgi:hypothetical protein